MVFRPLFNISHKYKKYVYLKPIIVTLIQTLHIYAFLKVVGNQITMKQLFQHLIGIHFFVSNRQEFVIGRQRGTTGSDNP